VRFFAAQKMWFPVYAGAIYFFFFVCFFGAMANSLAAASQSSLAPGVISLSRRSAKRSML
jgi:hypothetical protein